MSLRSFNNNQPNIGKTTYIDESAVIIGDVTLADNVSVWPTVVIRGDVASINIGADTNIQDGAVLHVSHAGKYAPEEALICPACKDRHRTRNRSRKLRIWASNY